jgi:hypothetical protein
VESRGDIFRNGRREKAAAVNHPAAPLRAVPQPFHAPGCHADRAMAELNKSLDYSHVAACSDPAASTSGVKNHISREIHHIAWRRAGWL